MSTFIYFLPRTATLDDWRGLGLAHAFDEPPAFALVGPERGPQGLSGTVFHRCPGPELPSPLVWSQAPGRNFWVGYHAHSRPGPDVLRRPVDLGAGEAVQVKLRDGNWWSVPRVLVCTQRDPLRRDGLPRILAAGDDGQTEERDDTAYDGLRELAGAFLHSFQNADVPVLGHEETLMFCSLLLGVCYRVGPAEVLALELLDRASAELLAVEAIDGVERLLAVAEPGLVARAEAENWNWAHVQQMQRLEEGNQGEEGNQATGQPGNDGEENPQSAISNPQSVGGDG